MGMGFPRRAEVDQIKERYLPGDRVVLVEMDDSQAPPAGTAGTVRKVDDIGQIHVAWDNGSSLALIPGVDRFKHFPTRG